MRNIASSMLGMISILAAGKAAMAAGGMNNSTSYDISNPGHEVSFGIEGGYRTSQLKWNIASDSTGTATPNILSELRWDKVSGYQVSPSFEYTKKYGFMRGLHIEASVNKSITTSGENQDSDYAGDNRTSEFSRSNNSSNAGHAEGYSAAIGYAFNFTNDRGRTLARFIALAGYAEQQQRFVMRDGNQTLATPSITPNLGPFGGLGSSYDASWKAPFIGASYTGFLTNTQRIKFTGQYLKGTYSGTGNWNLRDDFQHPVSFRHEADGKGFIAAAQYGWQFRPHTQFTLSGNYQFFRTDPGTDTTYLSSGATSSTRLNRADWTAQSYMAGLNYTF